ncbi:HAD family hydrolase [Nocardia cyriacigeorgica]|jgi:HAD superfamily hydrolase (TIGR01549 family)|uniref:HAD family hydrolase n=1 Tax=Nocardia cyriacigeorgica TaxID=135487 RepID=UPI000CEA02A0|nr:HAD-IA family hydrolase [Nocardia cyriacigeorgica]AVH21227.1 hypothetical protein C5B73_06830 [Nocardia cyriacigeorgica]MBF6499674.1 HAD family hydrolase [Nocardia cyriacigeorgica]PPJ07650.1 hypothetical protein C5E43_18455 [Nocardia cyriacigeorgica]
MTATLSVLLARPCLLLDFDGPVCAVFSGITDRTAALQLGSRIGATLPPDVASSNDPFDVLRYIAQDGPEAADAANQEFTDIEQCAVELARPTDDAGTLIREAAESGRRVAIVSNNSAAAIDRYLEAHGLREFVSGIYARTDGTVSHLKPSPYLLREAIAGLVLDTDDCVFVGDSVSDLEAGRAIGVPTVAYANRPEKIQRFAPHSPAAIVTSMADVLQAMRESQPRQR